MRRPPAWSGTTNALNVQRHTLNPWLGTRVRVIALVAAMAMVAGCGSTVANARRPSGQAAVRASDDLDAGADATTDATDAIIDAATGAATRTVATARRAGGSSSPVASAAKSTAVGPGVTADKIYVGRAYAVNSGAANAAIGATGITAGDPKRTAEIVIDDINAHGGVAGRKLEPVWHEIDGATTATNDVLFQQMCDTWTQDHKVFVGFAGGNDVMLQCGHSRNIALVNDDLTSADAATFRRFPYYVEIGTLNLDRLAAAEVAALKAQGFFSGWNAATGQAAGGQAKVGIVTFDDSAFDHATDQVMVPALKSLGITVAAEDIRRVQPNQRVSDTAPQAAAVSSAVLKLRTDGVTHVIVFDERGLLTLFFLQNAEAQGYRPRYGLNSQNGPQALMDGSGLPKRQLIGSKGVGWIPSLDLQAAQNPRNGPYANDARRRCYDLLASKGMSFADANAESIAMGICAELWFVREAVKASGNVLNRSGFMDGVAKLGTSVQSTGTFATRYSATQHDGAAAVRYYVFDEPCGCMKYTGGNINVP